MTQTKHRSPRTPWTRWAVFTVLAGVVALGAGCAHTAQPTSAEREVEVRDRGQAEITALYNRIGDMRLELGLKPRPARQFLRASTDDKDAPAWSPAAEPATPQCQDVCDLAEHICAAKDDICRIAGDMGDDPWSRDKCTEARASCREAKALCTSCK